MVKKNLSKSVRHETKKRLINPGCKISVKRQCRLLGISRSSFYYQSKACAEPDEKETITKNAIDRIWTENPYYGCRRIRIMLRLQHQIHIGKRRLRRYLQEMGIAVIYPGPNLSKRNLKHKIYPYLLRNVKAEHPNQVWGIDLTYIGMKRGWMYLVVIIDWKSRMIVGYAYSNTLHTGFVVECIKEAIKQHGKPLIINSDQGAQFTSDEYINLLKSQGIKISMNGRGRSTDNAITERFIRNLKQEQLYLMEYENGHQLRSVTADYIAKYNWQRPHQSLDYHIPGEVYHDIKNYQYVV